MRHIISITVENSFGVLARVAGMFSGRGFNIESLSVNTTDNPACSVMTIISTGDQQVTEQVIKQLRKLVNVIHVREVTRMNHIEREVVLVKVHATCKEIGDICDIVTAFGGSVIDMTTRSTIIEIVGSKDKIQSFLDVVRVYGLIEVVRSGSIAMARGNKSTTDVSK